MADQIDLWDQRLRHYDGVIAVFLFGSVARGRPMPWSDVDIALLFSPDADASQRESALEAAAKTASEQFGRECVPIDLGRQGLIMQHAVLAGGKQLLVRDHRALALFRWRVIREYLDFHPTYRIFENAQREYIQRLAGTHS